jgi:hypothetical protein
MAICLRLSIMIAICPFSSPFITLCQFNPQDSCHFCTFGLNSIVLSIIALYS